MEEAKLLQAPEVKVDKGNSSQCPGDGDGAHSSLCTRDEADNVGGKNEEEQRSQEGNVLLEAFADNVGANAFRNEVVAELEDVRELTVRYKRKLASRDKNQCSYQNESDQHVQDVLGYVPTRNGKDRRRVELRREMLCLLDEL